MNNVKYIGLDAHSSTCTFCVTDQLGTELEVVTMPTNGRLLVQFLKNLSGKKILTFEECGLSTWLVEIFRNIVENVVVCNPVANRQYKKAKTDILDARSLAHLLRGDFLTPVYHDGSKQEKLRALVSAYDDVTVDNVRLKNRYKALFRRCGTRLVKRGAYKDQGQKDLLQQEHFPFIAGQMEKQIVQLEDIRNQYKKEMKKQLHPFKETKLLRSIPGIDFIHAAMIISQVIDPKRFKNKHKFFSYCGLVRHPRLSGGQSYGTEYIWGNRMLKCVYKRAGRSVLNGKSSLRMLYDTLREKGVSEKNAFNAVCRKIASLSLSVWKHSKTYDDTIIKNSLIK